MAIEKGVQKFVEKNNISWSREQTETLVTRYYGNFSKKENVRKKSGCRIHKFCEFKILSFLPCSHVYILRTEEKQAWGFMVATVKIN